MLGLGFLDGMVIISIGLFVVALALIILSFTNGSAGETSESYDKKPKKKKTEAQHSAETTTPEQYAPKGAALEEKAPEGDIAEEQIEAQQDEDENEEQEEPDLDGKQSDVVVLSLIDYKNGENNKKYTFETNDEVASVGRHGKNDIVILNPMVSAKHCQISRIEDKIFIEDLGSTNGTVLHGKKITEKTEIKSGDKLRLGEIEYTVEI